MQVLTRPNVAGKFQEKWLKAFPEDPVPGSTSTPVDDSLTRLHWLQNFCIQSADPERPNLTGPGCVHPRSGSHQSHTKANPAAEVDYKNNPNVKPPYSYASLICMAMQASEQPKVTLSTIYHWITDNFCYYRHAEPSWQNSIRHNLSLNKCFQKVPREKNDRGKGGFWQIDPQYAHMFVNGVFKRKRVSANHYSSGGATHRDTLVQGCLRIQNGCPYRSGFVQTVAPPTAHNEALRATQPPLLAAEVPKADVHGGDVDLASVSDDVLNGNYGTFEDVDIDMALSLMGDNVDFSSDEFSALIPDQPEEALFQAWEELKESQDLPVAQDQGFSLYEGLFTDMLPW